MRQDTSSRPTLASDAEKVGQTFRLAIELDAGLVRQAFEAAPHHRAHAIDREGRLVGHPELDPHLHLVVAGKVFGLF